MTANEIANSIDKYLDSILYDAIHPIEEELNQAITMLRQQAKEIEELKKETPHILHTLHCTCGNYWNLDTYPPKLITKGSEK
jgi:hypothetical protein